MENRIHALQHQYYYYWYYLYRYNCCCCIVFVVTNSELLCELFEINFVLS